MITLTIPIIIHPNTYPALKPVRVEFDLRAQRAEFHLAPIKVTSGAIYLGVEEHRDTGVDRRYPQLMRVVTLAQNMSDPNPIVQTLMKSFAAWLGEVEPLLASVLTGQLEQIGTTMWALDGTYTPLGSRAVTDEIVDLTSSPAPAWSVTRTVGPTVLLEDSPPFGVPVPSFWTILRAWQPEPPTTWGERWATPPLPVSLTAVPEDNPPFSHLGRTILGILNQWHPNQGPLPQQGSHFPH